MRLPALKAGRMWITLVLTGLTASCSTVGPQLVPVAEPARRIEFEGFSILPPQGENWFLDSRGLGIAEAYKTVAMFRKMLTPPSLTHTVVAIVKVAELPLPPPSANRFKLLQQVVQAALRSTDRNRVVSSKVSEGGILGPDCARYDAVSEDSGVPGYIGSIFILNLHGFFCLHPDRPSYLIHIDYSERRLPREQPRSSLEAEGEPFLKSLVWTTIERSPGDAEGYLVRGNIYLDKGQYDQAIADYTRVLEINPRLPEAYLRRGVAYHSKGQYDHAIEDYSNTIRLGPDYAVAYNNRCGAYNSKGLFDRAIDDCTKAIELKLSPNLHWAYNNRGNAYAGKVLYDRAIEQYDRAIRLKPDYAEAYYNRGNAYGNKGQYDRAIQDYNMAIRIKPDYASALHQLAHLYEAQGKYAEAEPPFKAALAIEENTRGPEHPEVAQHLEEYAALLRKMKREAEAVEMEARAKAIRAKHSQQIPTK